MLNCSGLCMIEELVSDRCDLLLLCLVVNYFFDFFFELEENMR